MATTSSSTSSSNFRSDQQIQRDILAELRWDARVLPNEIGVSVKNGVVTLSGWVDAYTKKWAAEQVAHRVRGVNAVANDIEVRLPGSSQRTDADIAAAAADAIKWAAMLSLEKIDITVSDGWITLKGSVEWQYQKRDAERVVSRLTGVRGVSNLLEVKPRVAPHELRKTIEDALVRSVRTDAKHITVEVEGSKVILKGKVRSWVEKNDAERAAFMAPGITSVDNRITISN